MEDQAGTEVEEAAKISDADADADAVVEITCHGGVTLPPPTPPSGGGG